MICPGFVATRQADEQLSEQVRDLGIFRQDVVDTAMPGETVDRKFSTVEDTREFEPVVARDLPRPVCDDFDYRAATDRESLRQALLAADRRDVGRSFGLRQVREIAEVRDLASEIDLGVITVATDSAALLPSQVEQLRQMGLLIRGPRPTIRPSCSSSRVIPMLSGMLATIFCYRIGGPSRWRGPSARISGFPQKPWSFRVTANASSMFRPGMPNARTGWWPIAGLLH